MQLELEEEEVMLLKWAISMMSSTLLQNIIKTKQEIRNLSDEEKNTIAMLESNPNNLPSDQVVHLQEIVKGKELQENISNWQNQIKRLKDLDKKI